jgi:hypothetical protein
MRGLACFRCEKFMRIEKQGVILEEGMPTGTNGQDWKPYKLWSVDLYKCPSCGFMVTAGAGWNPISEHYMPDFAEKREKFPPLITVNDCGGAKP